MCVGIASPDKCLWYLAVNGSAAQTQGGLSSFFPLELGAVQNKRCAFVFSLFSCLSYSCCLFFEVGAVVFVKDFST